VRLRELYLEDHQHLIPLSTFKVFAKSLQNNMHLQRLTLGNEIMDGSMVRPNSKGSEPWQEWDHLLNNFWREPAYHKVTNQIRFFLQLNASGRRHVYEDTSAETLDRFMKRMPQLDGCFHILVCKPDLLFALQP
jgi:hypothetical protein